MATRRKTSRSKPARSGSTFFGVIIGLVLGLAAAVAVAFYITKAPMPFADRASRDPASILLPDVRDAPDPNLGLYSSRSDAPVYSGQTPLTGITPPKPSSGSGTAPAPDALGDLIASLPTGRNATTTAAPSPTPKATTPPTVAALTPPPAPPSTTTAKRNTYFLQAGAFRSAKDAEAIKARILMMGMEVDVQVAQLNGSAINRVRVGPFNGLDEMNRARANLGDQKIETSVVAQP